MTKIPASRLWLATSLLGVPVALWSLGAFASPSKHRANTRLAALPATAKSGAVAKKTGGNLINADALPRYVSMATIKRLQVQNQKLVKQSPENPLPVFNPSGKAMLSRRRCAICCLARRSISRPCCPIPSTNKARPWTDNF